MIEPPVEGPEPVSEREKEVVLDVVHLLDHVSAPDEFLGVIEVFGDLSFVVNAEGVVIISCIVAPLVLPVRHDFANAGPRPIFSLV